MKKNNVYQSKMMNNARNGQKAAQKASRLDRILDSGARYMSNFAVIRGNLPSFNSGSMSV